LDGLVSGARPRRTKDRDPDRATRLFATQARTRAFRRTLLAWYDAHRRDLPWRRDADSYRVWIAEAMLQQTRVEVVVARYEHFVARFADLTTLARASEEEVLAAWSGLGYYRRARNLHRAARMLVARGATEFPRDVAAARALPGVGAYIAAAVLSIAHGVPLAAVEANAVRVLSRLARAGWPDGRGGPHAAWAQQLLDRRRPSDWNQALMELGETVCLPRAPRCGGCPVERFCAARRDAVVALHPPPKQRRATERLALELTLIEDERGALLLERGAFPFLRDLWLPPSRVLQANARRHGAAGARRGAVKVEHAGSFRHTILHRAFAVRCTRTGTVRREQRDRLLASPGAGIERRFFSRSALDSIGRSSLLEKAMCLLERPGRRATKSPRDSDLRTLS